MTKKQLVIGKKYMLVLEDLERPLEVYYIGEETNCFLSCDHCGKELRNVLFFANKYYPNNLNDTWDSGTWRVGSTCLKYCISEIK